MFASLASDKKKTPVESKTQGANSSPTGKAAPDQNPLWQSLALGPTGIQAKLAISQPHDPYEQEADRVADRVMRMAAPKSGDAQPGLQQSRHSTLSYHAFASRKVQRKCGPCEEEEDRRIHRKEQTGYADSPATATPMVHEVLSAQGRPLDPVTRSFMEARFERNFGHVRVHTDSRAAQSARAMNALAYTVGGDVVFSKGQYLPESHTGKRLLAHELAHVVQQGGMDIASSESSVLGVQRQCVGALPVETLSSCGQATTGVADARDLIAIARSDARVMVNAALTVLDRLSQGTPAETAASEFQRLFGVEPTPANVQQVRHRFDQICRNLRSRGLVFACRPRGGSCRRRSVTGGESLEAFVVEVSGAVPANRINLCPPSLQSDDGSASDESRAQTISALAGTIVHELAHRVGVLSGRHRERYEGREGFPSANPIRTSADSYRAFAVAAHQIVGPERPERVEASSGGLIETPTTRPLSLEH